VNQTIKHTIEDDIKRVAEKKLSLKDFLRRLLEQFFYVVYSSASENNLLDIVCLIVNEENFVPLFTSAERFSSTPLSEKHQIKKIPFDELMRKMPPDRGVVLNPFNAGPYPVPWFILQEHIPGFGADVIKQEATPDWLERLNEDFSKREVPHGQRASEAVSEWSKINGFPISYTSIRARQIFDWFRVNIKPGCDMGGPLATGAFYHDSAFWEVTIPLIYGNPSFNPLDMLRMPASVKLRFCHERNEVFIFVKFFLDCIDYFYGVEELLRRATSNPLLAGFVASGREHITQAASLVLETRPNAKAAEAARFALEIFLKTYLVAQEGLGESDVRALGHSLKDILKRCLDANPKSELRHVEDKLPLYPEVSARYRADKVPIRSLWATYCAAVSAGAYVMRKLTGQDSTKDLQIPSF
jgi:hypothetical protein